MTRDEFIRRLEECRLIASVQASPGSPVDHPETLLQLAQASINEGVRMLRLQGIDNIRRIKSELSVPVIGLIKTEYSDSEIYITPTLMEVHSLIELDCEIIALDGTHRIRPGGIELRKLIQAIHDGGALAMADCDCLESAMYSIECGADLIGTTLAGYTSDRLSTNGPDLELLRELVKLDRPVIAEGRYSRRWEIQAALRIGAVGVVVGGALNDPVKQTRALMPHRSDSDSVGAFDIGGTWLRFALFGPDWKMTQFERVPNPPSQAERLAWISGMAERYEVSAIGVSSGGIIDPCTGSCWAAKEYLMPNQIGIEFSERTLGKPTFAHGDGHTTAWAHACLPAFAGKRVATLALGTGVGCGFVQEGRIWAGRRGEYPRINDLSTANGATFEALLGGLNLGPDANEEQKSTAKEAFRNAVFVIQNLYFPDAIVVGGSVGLSDWMREEVAEAGAIPSPFGTDAGLYGAAALVLFPPEVGE